MTELVAKSISHIFSPIIAWPIFLVIVLQHQPIQVWVPVLVFEFAIPLLLLPVFMKLKLVSDIEITNVKERRLFFIVLIISHMIATFLLWYYGDATAGGLRFLGLILEIVGTVITFFWKISAHLAANSFVIAVIMFSAIGGSAFGGGWQWWPLLLILPVVAWARVVRKKHTVMQTIIGGVVPFVIVLAYEYFSH